jgi:hypothetical protein
MNFVLHPRLCRGNRQAIIVKKETAVRWVVGHRKTGSSKIANDSFMTAQITKKIDASIPI